MTRRIALVGNPNVGKTTVFNGLTGLHQKTANWAGVTVSGAVGYFSLGGTDFSVLDLPGIYSFDVRSAEEAVTRDFVRDGEYDCLLLVCDATCLERGLFLLRQAAGILWGAAVRRAGEEAADEASRFPQFILCVNLCDEAEKKGIRIDFSLLERELGIPVAPCRAREKNGLRALREILQAQTAPATEPSLASAQLAPPEPLLPPDQSAPQKPSLASAQLAPPEPPLPPNRTALPESVLHFSPSALAGRAAVYTRTDYRSREERLDRFLTGPFTGGLTMCVLLFFVFWLTIIGANYPSSLLWDVLFRLEAVLEQAALAAGAPDWFIGAFLHGLYRVSAWIISVMLPPMAIFFPLFTLLEDFGYLPRAAFNLDGAFCKCHACGKQCLTMAMGLGCNAAGVTGCRIIDSPRERLIAILTNSLMPCNGRFPLLLAMISLFAAGTGVGGDAGTNGLATGAAASLSAFLLTLFILAGVAATLGASWLLSRTLLKGVPSSFTLELPPYRRPQFGKVLVRSIFDRTIFVLGRAVAVAAPAGLLIWVFANVKLGNATMLSLFSGFLDPFGRLMGLDGIILMAFLLGFPANEIVLPIILMAYLQTGVLTPMDDKAALLPLLAAHGWTLKTIVCMATFSLFHWPCSTTCLTIKKETGSLKWTAVSILIPTGIGVVLCMLLSAILTLAGW